jgi:TolB-like protein/Tfp pilus assembly protein PilF
MIRPDGLVKVLDFGLAKQVEVTPDLPGRLSELTGPAGPGVLMGTLRYMSPEQLKEEKVDARTDVWSLGVLVYEMVAARRPFDGPTKSEVVASILNAEPPSLSENLPDRLRQILSRALSKRPEGRYPTAAQMAFELRGLLSGVDGGAVTALPEHASGRALAASAGGNSGERPSAAGATRRTFPVRAAALGLSAVAVIALALGAYFKIAGRGREVKSVAVLPFANSSTDPDSEYLADGLTESLIDRLSRLPGVKVIARSSAFRYKGREGDVRAAARDLGVEAVLTGRIVRRGDALQISAELVEGETGYQLWSGRYTRGLSGLVSLQSELAGDISERLRRELSGEEQRRVTERPTSDAEAYQLYLRGRYHWEKRTREDLRKSIDYFKQAIDKDPGFARAYAGLANAYNVQPTLRAATPQDAFPMSKAAAERALEMDGTLAEARTALAFVKQGYEWKFAEAEEEYRRAIESDPNYAVAHHWYSRLLLQLGRSDEAVAEARRAQDLDPLSLNIGGYLARVYRDIGRYEEALEQARRTLATDRNYANSHLILWTTYEQMGRFGEAADAYEIYSALSGDDTGQAARKAARLREGYRRAGAKGYWKAQLEITMEGMKTKYVSPAEVASLYARLGEWDEAFVWLERAYGERDSYLVWLKTYPHFEEMRSDPRFQSLLLRIGFAPAPPTPAG